MSKRLAFVENINRKRFVLIGNAVNNAEEYEKHRELNVPESQYNNIMKCDLDELHDKIWQVLMAKYENNLK